VLCLNAAVVSPSEAHRFWTHVRKTKNCWEWAAALCHGGKGKTTLNGKDIRAHRFSWILHFGAIPAGMCVLHKCDNPKCVRPEHLFIGTVSENNKDRSAKGRSATKSRLTMPQIAEALHTTESIHKLANRWGVCSHTVYRAIKKYTPLRVALESYWRRDAH
jgi:hypothetical protein